MIYLTKFKVGDQVTCVNDTPHREGWELTKGEVYTVVSKLGAEIRLMGLPHAYWRQERFVPANLKAQIPGIGEILLKPRQK